MRCLLVTSICNEGSAVWEWVAHHLNAGFDDIIVFQNDSTDGTRKALSILQEIGAIKLFLNGGAQSAEKRNWQMRAYRRVSQMPEYHDADYVLALDGDEFLCVKTPEQTVQSLFNHVPQADEIRLNWKIFGSGDHQELSGELITERFTMAQKDDLIRTKPSAFKTLFRSEAFKRPGIHRPREPLIAQPAETNGSGMAEGSFDSHNWYSSDPEGRRFAQINHYILRDAQTFLLKALKGRPGFPPVDVNAGYWDMYNINDEQDLILQQRVSHLSATMERLNDLSGGRLLSLRLMALQKQLEMFERTQENPELRALYDRVCAR
ncbi:hypothetical protein GCM10007939_00010 [Amylibacter marinus]|uniref:Glycosyl transferase family 2 n=1 Tax=Amylibacter marinus TaxID=1475483 RepID=A0ABQ5VRJ0_9RHOB|nr:glycosyltransferase family 2 protein [Amylibacter marinus]GLQ33718.1 hypothetical protein GCM10007939_00010 [Amylibacter marinus]